MISSLWSWVGYDSSGQSTTRGPTSPTSQPSIQSVPTSLRDELRMRELLQQQQHGGNLAPLASCGSSTTSGSLTQAKSKAGNSSVPQQAPSNSGLCLGFGTRAGSTICLNMKVVLRGARKTGKTAMLHRLQGKPMPSTYTPSSEISAGTITWRPQRCEEGATVKVEVWDVVDKGTPVQCSTLAGVGKSTSKSVLKKLQKEHDGKTSDFTVPKSLPAELPPLDSTTVDVYQGCHCCIFLLDINRPETLDYIRYEAKKVPSQIPILICANFADMSPACGDAEEGEQPVIVTRADIEALSSSLQRAVTPYVADLPASENLNPATSGVPCFYIETALTTNYGLRPLHTYLNVPFTLLRIQVLEERVAMEYGHIQSLLGDMKEIQSRQSHALWSQHCEQASSSTVTRAQPLPTPTGQLSVDEARDSLEAPGPALSSSSDDDDNNEEIPEQQQQQKQQVRSPAGGEKVLWRHPQPTCPPSLRTPRSEPDEATKVQMQHYHTQGRRSTGVAESNSTEEPVADRDGTAVQDFLGADSSSSEDEGNKVHTVEDDTKTLIRPVVTPSPSGQREMLGRMKDRQRVTTNK